MTQSKFILEEVTDPAEIARVQAQDERHRRNSDWLQAHWADVLDNFDLILSRRRNEILLLALRHHYRVEEI